ncbi:MAG: preprotein translocase subunit SecE [Vicinamibacterales bacterium]
MKTATIETEATGTAIGGWVTRARTFLTEVRNELKRVTWPTRAEVYATTFVVILTSVVFGVYLWFIDMVLSRVVAWVFQALGAAA